MGLSAALESACFASSTLDQTAMVLLLSRPGAKAGAEGRGQRAEGRAWLGTRVCRPPPASPRPDVWSRAFPPQHLSGSWEPKRPAIRDREWPEFLSRPPPHLALISRSAGSQIPAFGNK